MQMARTNQALFAVWVVIAAFIAYLALGLVTSRHQVEERARAHAVSYVRLVEQHAAAAFERSDLALQGVIDHVLAGDMRAGLRLPQKRREEIETLLQAQQRRTPGIVAMPLADANGDVFAHSLDEPAGMSVSDRNHFAALKREPDTKVAISEAVLGRVSKRWGIAIGRRVDLADGSFGGMVGAQLDLNGNFIDFYATLPLGRNASVSLRDPGNRLLARYPALDSKLGGKAAPAGAVTERLRAGEAEGVLVTAATMDGIGRIFAFRRLAKFPVYAAVGLSLDEVLAPWRSERNAAAVGGLLIIAAGAFITLVLRRTQHAQSRLRQSEAQLSDAQRIANLGSWEWSKATDSITWSEELYRIFGLDPKGPAPTYREALNLYSPESQAQLAAAADAACANGTGYELELEHVRADGSSKWVIARGEPTCDAKGHVVGMRGTAEDITQRKRAELALFDSEAKFHGLVEQSFVGIAVGSLAGFQYVNPGLARIFGYTQDEMLRLTPQDLAADCDKALVSKAVSDGLTGAVAQGRYTFQGVRKDRSSVDIEAYGSRMLIAGKALAISIMVDISERRNTERALARASARNQLLLRTASDGIHVLGVDGKVLEASDAFCRMLGYAREELLGMNVTQWDVGSAPGGMIERLRRMQEKSASTTTFETRHRRRDGSVIDVEICSIGFEFDGEPMLFASARDVTERKRIQESMRHQAHFDALTGVPNRVLFYDRLNQGINLARRDRHELALLFLDLDKFKGVNDSLGHVAGDELLKITASRIRQTLRESDTVARVGGDEFTVILPRIASREDAAEVATKIIDAVSLPCELRNAMRGPHQVTIGASIGIAIFPADADDADRLVEAADAVMYSAKRTGNSYCFCGPRQSRVPAR